MRQIARDALFIAAMFALMFSAALAANATWQEPMRLLVNTQECNCDSVVTSANNREALLRGDVAYKDRQIDVMLRTCPGRAVPPRLKR